MRDCGHGSRSTRPRDCLMAHRRQNSIDLYGRVAKRDCKSSGFCGGNVGEFHHRHLLADFSAADADVYRRNLFSLDFRRLQSVEHWVPCCFCGIKYWRLGVRNLRAFAVLVLAVRSGSYGRIAVLLKPSLDSECSARRVEPRKSCRVRFEAADFARLSCGWNSHDACFGFESDWPRSHPYIRGRGFLRLELRSSIYSRNGGDQHSQRGNYPLSVAF